MAVGFTARGQAGGTTTATIASMTPSANSRLFVIAGARISSAGIPTVSDSLGGTWTLITGSNIAFGNVKGAVYYRDIGGSPAAMTVSCASTAAASCGLMVFEATEHSTDVSNFATNTNSAGDPSVTISAPSTGGYGIAAYIGNAGSAPTVTPTGYSLVYSSALATNLRMGLYTDSTSPGTTQAWTTPSTDSIGYGLEIKEAASNVAAGSAAGVATVSGVGQSTKTASGSAAGIATTAGIGTGVQQAAGSSAGIASATAVGQEGGIPPANDNADCFMVYHRRRARR